MLVLVCQYCLDLLYSLYPSKIVNSETSPLFEHDNALDTSDLKEELLDITNNIDQEVGSEQVIGNIASMGEEEFQKMRISKENT